MKPPPLLMALLLVLSGSVKASEGGPPLFQKGDRVVIVGNTFAERLSLFGYLETHLTGRFPDLELSFRNLGWSADTLSLQPRPLNFGDMYTHLTAQKVDVLIACFGMNEAFEGPAGLERFRGDWQQFLQRVLNHSFNGKSPPRVLMVSPIAHENLGKPLPDPAEHNRSLGLYTGAMASLAAEYGVAFVDLFTPTRNWMAEAGAPRLTFSGIHLTPFGDWVVARMILNALGLCAGPAVLPAQARAGAHGGPDTPLLEAEMELLRQKINEKNRQFFYRWRAVNGEYIYGRRAEPFGVATFPPEFEKLDEIVAELEKEIWSMAVRMGRRSCPDSSSASASTL